MTDWMHDQVRQANAYGLSDLLPDPPLTNKYSDLKEWVRQCRRGPVTLWGMLEAYRRGYRAARLEGIRLGLEAAAGEVWDGSRRDRVGATLAEAILDLDPETIAKENDQ